MLNCTDDDLNITLDQVGPVHVQNRVPPNEIVTFSTGEFSAVNVVHPRGGYNS